MLACPKCQSAHVVKNGKIHNGKQNFKCRQCGRQFAENPTKRYVSEETRALVDRLLLERLPLAGIIRVTGVSQTWLFDYLKKKYNQQPIELEVQAKKKGRLRVAMDEMWSFVGHKKNQIWLWLAQDMDSREIVGYVVGRRTEENCRKLWKTLPAVYRQCAAICTDGFKVYEKVLPQKRHWVIRKREGVMNGIERLNNTIRQRVSRLVRKTLSFSRSLVNHQGAIANFIHFYNESLHV